MKRSHNLINEMLSVIQILTLSIYLLYCPQQFSIANQHNSSSLLPSFHWLYLINYLLCHGCKCNKTQTCTLKLERISIINKTYRL
jgi:Pyruvate/2-oxoacid:ferredoxin oxidoreductase delta subunit